MKNLILLALCGAAAYYGYTEYLSKPNGAFDRNGNSTAMLFLFDECGQPCDDAEGFLKRKRIDYERINLSTGQEAEEKLKAIGGGRSMPILMAGSRRADGYHAKRYTEALGEAFGTSVLNSFQSKLYKTHFNADGSPKLVMYGAEWCPYCKQARDYFVENNLPFLEWDVEKQAEGKRYYDYLESNGYPLIYIGFRRVSGVDMPAVERALNEHPPLINK